MPAYADRSLQETIISETRFSASTRTRRPDMARRKQLTLHSGPATGHAAPKAAYTRSRPPTASRRLDRRGCPQIGCTPGRSHRRTPRHAPFDRGHSPRGTTPQRKTNAQRESPLAPSARRPPGSHPTADRQSAAGTAADIGSKPAGPAGPQHSRRYEKTPNARGIRRSIRRKTRLRAILRQPRPRREPRQQRPRPPWRQPPQRPSSRPGQRRAPP